MRLLPENYQSKRQQSGVALVVCLIMLLVITLTTIAGLGGASEQEKMASNAQQYNQTFQAAESAMAEAIIVINGIPIGGIPGNSQALANAMVAGEGVPLPVTSTLTTSYMDVTVTYTYEAISSLTPGVSLNADENSVIIGRERFGLEGKAIMASGARKTLSQGITYQ